MTTKEMIAVMEAYDRGETIEARCIGAKYWIITIDPKWNWREYEYRVRPEPPKPVIVPYDTFDELADDMMKHGFFLKDSDGKFFSIDSYGDGEVYVNCRYQGVYVFKLSDLNINFTWRDGAPCGKVVEQ